MAFAIPKWRTIIRDGASSKRWFWILNWVEYVVSLIWILSLIYFIGRNEYHGADRIQLLAMMSIGLTGILVASLGFITYRTKNYRHALLYAASFYVLLTAQIIAVFVAYPRINRNDGQNENFSYENSTRELVAYIGTDTSRTASGCCRNYTVSENDRGTNKIVNSTGDINWSEKELKDDTSYVILFLILGIVLAHSKVAQIFAGYFFLIYLKECGCNFRTGDGERRENNNKKCSRKWYCRKLNGKKWWCCPDENKSGKAGCGTFIRYSTNIHLNEIGKGNTSDEEHFSKKSEKERKTSAKGLENDPNRNIIEIVDECSGKNQSKRIICRVMCSGENENRAKNEISDESVTFEDAIGCNAGIPDERNILKTNEGSRYENLKTVESPPKKYEKYEKRDNKTSNEDTYYQDESAIKKTVIFPKNDEKREETNRNYKKENIRSNDESFKKEETISNRCGACEEKRRKKCEECSKNPKNHLEKCAACEEKRRKKCEECSKNPKNHPEQCAACEEKRKKCDECPKNPENHPEKCAACEDKPKGRCDECSKTTDNHPEKCAACEEKRKKKCDECFKNDENQRKECAFCQEKPRCRSCEQKQPDKCTKCSNVKNEDRTDGIIPRYFGHIYSRSRKTFYSNPSRNTEKKTNLDRTDLKENATARPNDPNFPAIVSNAEGYRENLI